MTLRSALLPFRWPPFVAAWIAVAAGHALAAGLSIPGVWESRCRLLALLAGLLALTLDARAKGSWARLGNALAIGLATLAFLAAGASLGLEATRRGAPLEVHPRPIHATIFGFVADASRAEETPPTLRLDVAAAAVGTPSSGGDAATPLRGTVRLLWPAGAPAPSWAVAGTPIAAAGLVRPLEDARNPGGTSTGRWLEREGIDATFEVEAGSVEPWSPPAGTAGKDRRGGARLAAEIRRSLGRLFDAHVPAAAAALARGMLLGDRVGIDAETRDSFRNAGTLHILSISGLHVCIVAGFVALCARALRLGSVAGTAIEFAALAAYVLFVGAPPPALRSAALWTLARGARLAGRGAAPFAGWGAAGLALHLADPRAPLDLGFLLSFGAVLGLEAGSALAPTSAPDARTSWWRRIAIGAAATAAVGVGASLGTMPIEATAFGSIPIAGPVANLVVIPLTTLFLAEAILLVLVAPVTPPLVGDLLGGALGASGDLLRIANDHLGGHVTPLAVHGLPALGAVAASYLALLGIAGLRHPPKAAGGDERTPRIRAVAIATLALLAAMLPILSAAGAFRLAHARPPRLVALDVGQGDASLLVGGSSSAIAIDAGPRSEHRDEGRLTVEPALRAEGVRGRVLLIASHGHRDHEGGIVGLARRGWIARVVENGGGSADRDAWRAALRASGGADEVARGGPRRASMAGWAVVVAAPRSGRDLAVKADLATYTGSPNAAENDRSLVAIASVGDARVLFPGDLERAGEEAWLASGLDSALVLKVPHHGSRTSSTAAWVARVHPAVAIVSAGEGNRYGHPSPETLRRYRCDGAAVARTDREGSIRVTFTAAGPWLSTRAHPAPRPVRRHGGSSLSPYFDFP